MCGAVVAVLILLMASPGAATGEPRHWWENIQLHGFLSQGLVWTSDNRWYGDSPDTSFEFTEIGINASIRPVPKLLISAQVLSRIAGDMYDGTPELDYGHVDITLNTTDTNRFGIMVGRNKNPLGLYNETRDVPFTRPGIFLPQTVYFDKVRNLIHSSDGLILYADVYRDFGTISAVIGGGRIVSDENVEWALLGADVPGDFGEDTVALFGNLWYKSPTERIKLGFSIASMRLELDDAPADTPPDLVSGYTDVLYNLASFQYNLEKLSVSVEYLLFPLKYRDYGPSLPYEDSTVESFYVQASYRFDPRWEIMMRYDYGVADRDDRDGTKFSESTGGFFPAHYGFSKILTAGLRWDISSHWMARLEYSYNQGTYILSERENPLMQNTQTYWNMVAAQLSFRF